MRRSQNHQVTRLKDQKRSTKSPRIPSRPVLEIRMTRKVPKRKRQRSSSKISVHQPSRVATNNTRDNRSQQQHRLWNNFVFIIRTFANAQWIITLLYTDTQLRSCSLSSIRSKRQCAQKRKRNNLKKSNRKSRWTKVESEIF